MRRQAVPVAAVVAVVVLVAIAALWLRPGDESSTPTPAPTAGSVPAAPPEPSAAVAGSDAVADPETRFIDATAGQLCAAQSRVYDTPEALAAAYVQPPDYSGLTPEQVDLYKERLAEDQSFSSRLTATLAGTCRPGTAPDAATPSTTP